MRVCRKPLPAAGAPVTVTDDNFLEIVERSTLPVLLDLWAPWCGPCRMVAPAVEQLAGELAGRLLVGKLNVDDNPITADRFQIRNIPALLLLRNGLEIDRIVGAQPEDRNRRAPGSGAWSAIGGKILPGAVKSAGTPPPPPVRALQPR